MPGDAVQCRSADAADEQDRRGLHVTVEQKLMTADDLLRLPRGHGRHELVRGELRTMPPAGSDHGEEDSRISRLLSLLHVRANELGRVWLASRDSDWRPTPDTVRAPDVAFVRRDRVPARGAQRGYFEGAPDLAVEVISPNDLTPR